MKKKVFSFIALPLLVIGGVIALASVANATDSIYWESRIAFIKGTDLSENEKAFKIKMIRKYMGKISKNDKLVKFAAR